MARLAILTFSEDPPADVLERVRAQVQQSVAQAADAVISPNSTNRVPASIRAQVSGRMIVIDSDVHYTQFIDRGHGPATLYSLIGKIVPLKLRSGVTIFRRVSAEAIRKGKWRIPMQPGTGFVRDGVMDALAKVPQAQQFRPDFDQDVEEIYI